MKRQGLNLKVLKDILEQKNISVNAFAKQLNMTGVGLRRILRENTTSQATLTKISESLEVPISTFYTESNTPQNSVYEELYEHTLEEIKRLKKQIARNQSEAKEDMRRAEVKINTLQALLQKAEAELTTYRTAKTEKGKKTTLNAG